MPRRSRIPELHQVTDDTMMPLSVAAEVAVAHGVVSSANAKALRREAEYDRLATYEVFGRLHTTLGDIKRMAQQGRVPARMATPARKPAAAIPSSETPAAPSVGRAAAMESVRRLKERCRELKGQAHASR